MLLLLFFFRVGFVGRSKRRRPVRLRRDKFRIKFRVEFRAEFRVRIKRRDISGSSNIERDRCTETRTNDKRRTMELPRKGKSCFTVGRESRGMSPIYVESISPWVSPIYVESRGVSPISPWAELPRKGTEEWTSGGRNVQANHGGLEKKGGNGNSRI
jgi:hypothetical protein